MIELSDVEEAYSLLEGTVKHTPLRYSSFFSESSGADVYLKLENLQRTGAFKIRGAYNKIKNLETDKDGVVAASAGNHAQGVALAASEANVDAKVVMPKGAPISKVEATRSYGADVELYGIDYDEAQKRAIEIQEQENRELIHPFDDPLVQAGQGTIGLEILEEISPDFVIVPIGGGGLISGIATAIKEKEPTTKIVGVEAEGAASVLKSLQKGEIFERKSVSTISDGIATRKIANSTLEIIKQRTDDILEVTDDRTSDAILHLLEREKTVAEGAGAVSIAALDRLNIDKDDTVVCILSGGNIDSNVLSQVINRGLMNAGRYLKFRTVLKDKPGSLAEISRLISEEDSNIYAIHHDRMAKNVAVNAAEVEFHLETRNRKHANKIVRKLEKAQYEIEVIT